MTGTTKYFIVLRHYHHKKRNGEEDSLNKIEKNYSKLGKEMRFPFFDLAFLKNYFDESEVA